MARNRLSDCGATDEEVVESLQEEFDGMQRTARAYAARCRELEAALHEICGHSTEQGVVAIAECALGLAK